MGKISKSPSDKLPSQGLSWQQTIAPWRWLGDSCF